MFLVFRKSFTNHKVMMEFQRNDRLVTNLKRLRKKKSFNTSEVLGVFTCLLLLIVCLHDYFASEFKFENIFFFLNQNSKILVFVPNVIMLSRVINDGYIG